MLKTLTYFLFIFCSLCQCNTSDATLTLKSDNTTISVDPLIGGRISSLTYQEKEILKTSRDSANIQWGSTLWTSPQSDWKWPPPEWIDSDPYKVIQGSKNKVILESDLSPQSKLQCTKSIEVVGKDSFLLTYTIMNLGSGSQKLALWENSRIPHQGHVTWLTQKELWELGPDGQAATGESSWLFLEKRVTPRKLFKKSQGGYLRYETENLIWTKSFEVLSYDQIAPNHAAIEIYDDPVMKFAELEIQGRYQTLNPKETITLKVLWSINEKGKQD